MEGAKVWLALTLFWRALQFCQVIRIKVNFYGLGCISSLCNSLGMDVGDEVVWHVVVRKNPEIDWSGREGNIDGGNRSGQQFNWG